MRHAFWMTTSFSKCEGPSWLPAPHRPSYWLSGSNVDGKNQAEVRIRESGRELDAQGQTVTAFFQDDPKRRISLARPLGAPSFTTRPSSLPAMRESDRSASRVRILPIASSNRSDLTASLRCIQLGACQKGGRPAGNLGKAAGRQHFSVQKPRQCVGGPSLI
jgi:hypothetical protein